MISREDKRTHPVFYWAFLVLLALCAIQLFSIAIGEAEGAYTANTYNSSSESSLYTFPFLNFVHSKNDQLVTAFVNSDDELWVAHKPSTSGSWEYGMIDGVGTDHSVCGLVCSSNNTIAVYALRIEGGVYKTHLWIKWPGSAWDEWVGYYVDGGGSSTVAMDIAINNTDNIACGYRVLSTASKVKIFNLTTLTFSLAKTFSGSSNSYLRVAANQSGSFWVFYTTTGLNGYFRDYNQSFGATTVYGSNFLMADLICLPNDRFGIMGKMTTNFAWFYQNSHNGAWTIAGVSNVSTWTYGKASISQGSSIVYLMAYNSAAKKVYEWHAAWDAITATWQASQTPIASVAVTHWALGASNQIWPKESGVSWCLPVSGQMFNVWKDTGATDDMQLWHQNVIWTPDLTTDWPEITTSGLDQGTYDELYTFGMSRSGGTAPFEWTIVSGPVWLEIGLTTGILSGTPPGVGTFSVEIQLADVIPRTDTESFSLKINPVVTEGGDEFTEGFTMEQLQLGELWLLLAIAAIGVGLAREYKRFTHR